MCLVAKRWTCLHSRVQPVFGGYAKRWTCLHRDIYVVVVNAVHDIDVVVMT